MTGKFHRRFKLLLASTMAAFGCWWLVPGTALDRAAFNLVARGFANPPFFISGDGSRQRPWRLRTFASTGKPDLRQAPVIVSLGDDLEGFFQSSPPSPIDLAVVLTNFQRLGAKKAATGAVLAWDSPDPIGLAALDKALGGFDSLVMAAPLSRGATPEAMPTAFRNASVPLDSIHGDSSSLPIVNRIPLPGVILGREKTLAGFQFLESEKSSGPAPLMARWEDRVVFAFPLLTVLQRHDLALAGMEIRPGEYIKLGLDGPTVPIDRYGRLAMPIKRVSPYSTIQAEALIDGGEELFPKQAPEPVILSDDRSGAEPATRAFSRTLPAMVATIASDTGLAGARDHPRLAAAPEVILLALVVLMTLVVCRASSFSRNILLLAMAGASVTAQFVTFAFIGWWLPGIAALAAIAAAFLFSKRTVETFAITKPHVIPQVVEHSVVAAIDTPPEVIAPPPKTIAKKAPQRPKKRRK